MSTNYSIPIPLELQANVYHLLIPCFVKSYKTTKANLGTIDAGGAILRRIIQMDKEQQHDLICSFICQKLPIILKHKPELRFWDDRDYILLSFRNWLINRYKHEQVEQRRITTLEEEKEKIMKVCIEPVEVNLYDLMEEAIAEYNRSCDYENLLCIQYLLTPEGSCEKEEAFNRIKHHNGISRATAFRRLADVMQELRYIYNEMKNESI